MLPGKFGEKPIKGRKLELRQLIGGVWQSYLLLSSFITASKYGRILFIAAGKDPDPENLEIVLGAGFLLRVTREADIAYGRNVDSGTCEVFASGIAVETIRDARSCSFDPDGFLDVVTNVGESIHLEAADLTYVLRVRQVAGADGRTFNMVGVAQEKATHAPI